MGKIKSSYEEKYQKEVVPALMKEFNYKNVMQVPRLQKIVVNSCLSEALQNAKVLETAAGELMAITGQKPVVTTARKSIAAFKLRAGVKIGVCVTLRGGVMYEFLNRLCNVALPRVRDFRGVSGRSFDGKGNYSLGITEQIIFPEINYDKIDKIRGMNVTIVTSAKTDGEGKALLKHMGMPFRN
jgi:large subunit ribosomal protein L5